MPLDMAAAGLITVTNTFATKTSEKLTRISTNLIGVPPTLESLNLGLVSALGEVDNVPKRVAGARLNWSNSWDDTFNTEIMMRLRDYLDAPTRT
jgi:chitinase